MPGTCSLSYDYVLNHLTLEAETSALHKLKKKHPIKQQAKAKLGFSSHVSCDFKTLSYIFTVCRSLGFTALASMYTESWLMSTIFYKC